MRKITITIVLLFVLHFIFANLIYAEVPFYLPNGVKLRLGVSDENVRFLSENEDIKIDSDRYEFTANSTFPIQPIFPETLFKRFLYGNFFIDLKYDIQKNASEAADSHNRVTRNKRLQTFLTAKEINTYCSSLLTDTPEQDCLLLAETSNSHFILGYRIGVFIPISDSYRFLKAGLGYGMGMFETDVKLSICDLNPSSDVGTALAKDECEQKEELVKQRISYTSSILIPSFTLFEYVESNSAWSILTLQYNLTSTSFDFDNRSPEFTIQNGNIDLDLLSVKLFF